MNDHFFRTFHSGHSLISRVKPFLCPIIQHELDSISPPAVQCFVDYYNSSRGFTPHRQSCQQWNRLWIYSPFKIKTQRWRRVMPESLCVSGLISGELFHSIYCLHTALHIKMIKYWLKLFLFASHAFSIFEHNMVLSLTRAREHRIAWISTKSLKVLLGWCFLQEKYASFIPPLLLVKRLLSTDWWESLCDVKSDN